MAKVRQNLSFSHGIFGQMRNFSQSDSSFRRRLDAFWEIHEKSSNFLRFNCQNSAEKETTFTTGRGRSYSQECEESSDNEYPLNR